MRPHVLSQNKSVLPQIRTLSLTTRYSLLLHINLALILKFLFLLVFSPPLPPSLFHCILRCDWEPLIKTLSISSHRYMYLTERQGTLYSRHCTMQLCAALSTYQSSHTQLPDRLTPNTYVFSSDTL